MKATHPENAKSSSRKSCSSKGSSSSSSIRNKIKSVRGKKAYLRHLGMIGGKGSRRFLPPLTRPSKSASKGKDCVCSAPSNSGSKNFVDLSKHLESEAEKAWNLGSKLGLKWISSYHKVIKNLRASLEGKIHGGEKGPK
jgi:hypothetical protein